MFGREYRTLKALRSGAVVDFGGILLEMDEGEIRSGDLYVAERNTGPHLLTAREVSTEHGCIHSTCTAYSFDIGECVKVREVQQSTAEGREVYTPPSVGYANR
ncbi:MAG: hypothetical protein AAB897_01680 [Patescibacteria group bacterium]